MPRTAVSSSEKKALRARFQQHQPRPSQKELLQWFEATFKRKISQSTLSVALSNRYRHLDTLNEELPRDRAILSRRKQRAARWPLLEEILFQWQSVIDSRGGLINGPLLIEKAYQIWDTLPEYSNQERPEFSDGWLTGFKSRYSIKRRVRHGEAADVPLIAEEEMRAVRTLCGEYEEADIYNMNETGLFWRQTPSSGLSSQNRPGTKSDKTRVTIALCTNYTGSDRLPPWFIGKTKVPHALRGVNFTALGGVWHANKKAWMNQFVMKEWLESFYRHVGTRRVLLLMDNFKSHQAGLELTPPPSNVRIQWLPANSASKFQPLDQGIIQNLKVYYRRQFLRFMVNYFNQGEDPLDHMNIYLACKWTIRAWFDEIQDTTIYNCFRKSSILQADPISLPRDRGPDLSSLYEQAQQASGITDAMDLSRFLNPEGEDEGLQEGELPTDPLMDIIASFPQESYIDPNLEDDDSYVEPRNISPTEALHSLQVLLEFQLRQEDAKTTDIGTLRRLERTLQLKATPEGQATLDSWLN